MNRQPFKISNFDEDQDSFNLGSNSILSLRNRNDNQFIFKITSNFIEEQFQSDIVMNSQSSQQDSNLQSDQLPIKPQCQVKGNKMSEQQIMKINNINQNFRFIVAAQHQLKEQLGRMMCSQELNIPDKNDQNKILQFFKQKVEQRMQGVMLNRIQSLPRQNREYYLGSKDKNQIHKRKHIHSLIRQQLRAFQAIRGLNITQQPPNQQLTKMNGLFQEYIRQYNQEIDSELVRGRIEQITLQEEAQLRKDMISKSISRNRQLVTEMHRFVNGRIEEQLQAEHVVWEMDLVRKMQRQRSNVQNSQDLFQFIPSKYIFALMGNQKPPAQQASYSRVIPASFSKNDHQ